MENSNSKIENKLLKRFAEIIQSDRLPPPRFGHTVNLISKISIIIFGGAISTTENPSSYTMTSDLYLYNMATNQWKKLETSSTNKSPHVRAAHASATVRENQVLFYGGSIGNGQYASDDLWFLDIKNQEEANWMQVPVEGMSPGPRYGHSMVYIYPILILFGGSTNQSPNQKNIIMKDVWVFPTDKTPFKWIKLDIEGSYFPSARLYHTSCTYPKYIGDSDALVLFGGRDDHNNSLKDLCLLVKHKNESGQEFYQWHQITPNITSNDSIPVGRHQHSTTIFGPFLFSMGGRSSTGAHTTFDVYSFMSNSWYRFGSIGLFRHTIWIYFNDIKLDNIELYLYVYGGFDSEHNPEINSRLYRINIIDLFSKNDILKNELFTYLNTIMKKNNKNNANKNLSHFELSNKVVVYNIPEENNFSTLVKEVSYGKLTEVDKKIRDKANEIVCNKPEFDESLINEFLQLLPTPDIQFIPYKKNEPIITLNSEYIIRLIDECKKELVSGKPIIKLKSPVKIFGSIHGQYNDLLRYFTLFGRPSELKGDIECVDYLFLGNFTNRGAFSLETFCLLITLRIKHTGHFHILRGNLEDLEMSKYYGLAEECKEKLKENINDPNSVFQRICDLFNYLPLVAVINNQILCVHSGIGNNFKNLNELEKLKFPISVKDTPIAQDILWSIPLIQGSSNEYDYNNATSKYRQNTFDESMVLEFFKNNRIKMIIRSHDVCDLGMAKIYGDKIITIFSATSYCNIYNNSGAMLFIKKSYEIQPKMLTCEDNTAVWQRDDWNKTDYPPSPKRNFNN